MTDKKISQLTAVTDVQAGDEYVVVRSGANYRISGASLSAAFGGGGSQPITVGDGTPLGNVVPSQIGALYIEQTAGSLWIAVGLTNADWLTVAGVDPTPFADQPRGIGYRIGQQGALAIISGPGGAFIQDQAAAGGTDNGIYWTGGDDGTQEAQFITGSTGQFTARINAKGNLRAQAVLVSAHAAPADGDIATGECALWFDQTNGAAKLKIKGKSANGTVVTGSVDLT